jgi:hypothetical protein
MSYNAMQCNYDLNTHHEEGKHEFWKFGDLLFEPILKGLALFLH